jgi:hypothetical protein
MAWRVRIHKYNILDDAWSNASHKKCKRMDFIIKDASNTA